MLDPLINPIASDCQYVINAIRGGGDDFIRNRDARGRNAAEMHPRDHCDGG